MVIVMMGVSGSGKSTVGRALAERIRGRFVDADEYHPPTNVAKMRGGTPLTDDDREAWLRTLRSEVDAWLAAQETVVLACSALTRRSRQSLGTARDGVRLVHLRGTPELIAERMRGREHFMPASLLASQFATLEPPEGALELDAARSPDELVTRIVADLEER
jgi:gluconokinase